MAHIVKRSKRIENHMKKLGQCIAECRGTLSMSQLARRVGLPPSNMMYIEQGTNAPTAEVYGKLINALNPDEAQRRHMDDLFMKIRGTPPPDVCRILIENKNLIDAIRLLENRKISKTQSKQVEALLTSFVVQEEEGAAIHE